MNKKYKVYGIGNALVDIDIKVNDDVLTRLGIEKGVMTLVDEQRHHQLVDALHDYPQIKACGGSAANTLIAVSQFGAKGFYSCKVADDVTGDVFISDLLGHGLDCNLSESNRNSGVTGKCLVMVTPDADRTMNTHLGITETLSVDEVDVEAIKQSEYLYIEGYLVASETARKAAILAHDTATQHQVKTAITLSDPNMTRFFREGLVEMIGGGVDLLFCNLEEALIFSQTTELEKAIEYLSMLAKQVLITKGAEGALLINNGEISEKAGVATTALDTVGAGDMFAGSYLYAITHGIEPGDAVAFANHCAATIVSQYGPRLSNEKVQTLKQQLLESA